MTRQMRRRPADSLLILLSCNPVSLFCSSRQREPPAFCRLLAAHVFGEPAQAFTQSSIFGDIADTHIAGAARSEWVAWRDQHPFAAQQSIRKRATAQTELPDRHPEEVGAGRPTWVEVHRL